MLNVSSSPFPTALDETRLGGAQLRLLAGWRASWLASLLKLIFCPSRAEQLSLVRRDAMRWDALGCEASVETRVGALGAQIKELLNSNGNNLPSRSRCAHLQFEFTLSEFLIFISA